MRSLESEKLVLASLIQHPNSFIDVSDMIDESDFDNDHHRIIYQGILRFVANAQEFDVHILANYLGNKGFFMGNDNTIDEYVKNLSFIKVNPKMIRRYVEELKVLTARRMLHETGQKLMKYAKSEAQDVKLHQILEKADSIFNTKIQEWSQISEPMDLFGDMMEQIEAIGQNPLEELGIASPYPTYNQMFGGFVPGNLYAYVARPGQGKSTLLMDMAYKMQNEISRGTPIIMLDTEMETKDVQARLCSAMSGVPLWYLETGNWTKNMDMVRSVREVWKKIKGHKLDHYYVAGKPIDEVCNIIKRWYYTKVGRGNECVVFYDYLKMTGEKLSEYNKEYQAIGDKVSKLKDLVTEEVRAPLITACQMNRSGDKEKPQDDSTAIAQSDRLLWFASHVAILRRRTQDEQQDEPVSRFGTHKLITLKSRRQGKLASGHQDVITVPDPDNPTSTMYTKNFINFNMENFKVEDKGSAKEMYHKLAYGVQPEKDGKQEDVAL